MHHLINSNLKKLLGRNSLLSLIGRLRTNAVVRLAKLHMILVREDRRAQVGASLVIPVVLVYLHELGYLLIFDRLKRF